VPLATTEGALIASTNRGARAIAAGEGVRTELLGDGMTRAPVVECVDLRQVCGRHASESLRDTSATLRDTPREHLRATSETFPASSLARDAALSFSAPARVTRPRGARRQAAALKRWFEAPDRLPELQRTFSATSRFGQLLGVKVALAGRHAFVRFRCATGDAMGMNMVGKGVNTVLAEALETPALEGAELIGLSGNYCTDKKPAAVDGSSAAARSAKIDRAYRRGLPGVGQLDRGAGQARRGGGGHPCKGGA